MATATAIDCTFDSSETPRELERKVAGFLVQGDKIAELIFSILTLGLPITEAILYRSFLSKGICETFRKSPEEIFLNPQRMSDRS